MTEGVLLSGAPEAPAGRELPGGILFLIRALDVGGAQRQLVALLRELHSRGHRVEVAVFYAGGEFEAVLRADGIPVHDLGKRSRWDVPRFVARLARLLRTMRPAVLHGYLGEGNLMSLLAPAVVPGTRVVWGVRASNMDLSRYGRLSRHLFALSCRVARFADGIIYNSRAGADFHERAGYPPGRGVVIPNGIDTRAFTPSAEARARVREEWGIDPTHRLIGIAGRIDPMKGHDVFLDAAARLAARREDVRFVVVGEGAGLDGLQAEARRRGIHDRITWAGGRTDMRDVYAALDIATSASIYGEGFPNVIGEAMACGVPCVVTDVGDNRRIVGTAGVCVPPGDAEALSDAWQVLLQEERGYLSELGARARERVVDRYSVGTLADRTLRALQHVVLERDRGAGGRTGRRSAPGP